MSDDGASWRPATAADLDAVERIGNAVHVSLQERPEVFANKLALFPPGCFVLARNGDVSGYGIAHPWALGSVPALDTVMAALPAAPTCLYIHDVVVLEAARGQGAAGVLVDVFEAVARRHALSRPHPIRNWRRSSSPTARPRATCGKFCRVGMA